MGHQKPRGVVVQREEGVSMVLPCAMVPQIVLYGLKGEKCDDCYLSITTGGENDDDQQDSKKSRGTEMSSKQETERQ